MGTTMDQNAGTVAILEATAEARTLIEDLSRLGEELKVRQEGLGELLAPSEALRARTEYLDQVMREELGRAEQRVLKLSQDVEKIARHLNDYVVQMPARLAEADARRWTARERRGWRMVVSLLAMLLGGFLAGEAASYRSGGDEREDVNGRSREQGYEEPIRFATPSSTQAERCTRALSREEVAQSADLQRCYALEYSSMLRVVSDREVAKEAARVNVSALVAGQPRIVPLEGRFRVEMLRSAITRGDDDLGVIRRAVSRLIERAAPGIDRPLLPRVRDFGPER